MWVVYLVFLVLAVVRAAKLQYCQELLLKGSALRRDVATMVFTIDSTCLACYHEIQKLVKLKTQMARLGHPAEIMVALNQLPHDDNHQMPSEVTVDLEDVWKKLGQLNGHIFVFDKCGKLAYQVITPWSRQVYPFTAMAGLSALYDAPCGECNVTSQANELQEVSESFGQGPLQSKLPLTITIRDRHENVHISERVTYDTVEHKTNGHNDLEQGNAEAEVKEYTPNTTTNQKNATRPEGNHPNNAREDKSPNGSPRPAHIDRKNGTSSDSQRGNFQGPNGVSHSAEPITEPSAGREYAELLGRYQPLMKWRTCANLVMSIQV